MPELPEVETVCRGLRKNIIAKQIADFSCDWLKMLNLPLKKYKADILKQKITSIRRVAKMIVIDLTNDWHLLIHLKMTGQLVYSDKVKCVVGGHPIAEGYDCLPNKFTHVMFKFTDNSFLFFNDIRKFGWVRLFNTQGLATELASLELGPDPLSKEFTLAYFEKRLQKKPRVKIKQFLMDAKNVVGIGNIYSDEVCYYAGIRPNRLSGKITKTEVRKLYTGIGKILRASIKAQGTTFSDYRMADGEAGQYYNKLKVYGRYGEQCKRCQTTIVKIKLGGRTSSYCPQCQR